MKLYLLKYRFLRTLVVLSTLAVCFLLADLVHAQENFDAYNTGAIDAQSNDWTYYSGAHLEVTDTIFNSAPHGLLLNANYNNGGTLYNPSEVGAIDTVTFKFKFNDGSSQYVHIYGQNSNTYDTANYTEDIFGISIRRGVFNRFYGDSATNQNYVNVGSAISDTNWHTLTIQASSTPQFHRMCVDGTCGTWLQTDRIESWDSLGFVDSYHNHPYNQTFDDFVFTEQLPPFAITNPVQDQEMVNDTWITVEGVCPTNGANRIGLTNDCLGFESIDYTVSCVDGQFSTQFYKSGLSERVIAREIDSVSGDCVDYDDLMDFVTVDGIEFVDGYPEDWYFNFGLYDDYNIQIKSPSFDTALTLPKGSTSKDFTFGFTYPDGTIDDLTFNIKQYDSEGTELNPAFHTRTLASMADTSDYTVTLSASTTPYHYVVQLIEDGTLKRQYPFGIYVSDLEFVGNPDDNDGYFFPRIVDELRKKIVFNYYFAFHDGFYNMFNGQYSSPSPTALDITFKSVSGNGQYDIDVKVFSASDPRVKAFASGLRPYIVALLWLGFALYVVFRVTHLFSDNQ